MIVSTKCRLLQLIIVLTVFAVFTCLIEPPKTLTQEESNRRCAAVERAFDESYEELFIRWQKRMKDASNEDVRARLQKMMLRDITYLLNDRDNKLKAIQRRIIE